MLAQKVSRSALFSCRAFAKPPKFTPSARRLLATVSDPEFAPENYPPFPEEIPTAPIEKISLRKLLNRDQKEADRLFEASKTYGFFYLNCRDSEEGEELEHGAINSARLAEEFFKLGKEEKDRYAMKNNKNTIFGYKEAGGSKTDSKGTKDTAEFMNIAKDSIVNNATWPLPKKIKEDNDVLSPFVTTAHSIGLDILKMIGTQLQLPPSAMESRHRITDSSGDQVRMTRSPPLSSTAAMEAQIATPSHTDFGSITILFNWLGGLQIWEPENPDGNKFWSASRHDDKGKWNYVKPIPGHAICNLGDGMTKFSNGILNSGKHRVVPAPGAQGDYVRYSIVYFVRPTDETPLKVLDSPAIPKFEGEEEVLLAKEHIANRARGLGINLN
ncbi:Clavaminate synthase-like protein [Aulographum hederae CBS 113979]|uniref:Clavaminate synthase-like protein n=1 Tax=Aulographum hederae CBS 113979 TaxID=1176131 RepID=A0A6G1H2G1_9PEZI|nr:Clavaminate synthase-like protein [Aulographum hederae CBS 113979]